MKKDIKTNLKGLEAHLRYLKEQKIKTETEVKFRSEYMVYNEIKEILKKLELNADILIEQNYNHKMLNYEWFTFTIIEGRPNNEN